MDRPMTLAAWGRRCAERPWLVPLAFALVFGLLQTQHRHPIVGTVENDFLPHAAHASSWSRVFTVDGLQPLGYPFVLRTGALLLGDAFLAARLLALLAAVGSLFVIHAIATRLHSPTVALVAQVALAANWYFQETALLVGTDLVAACATLFAVLGTIRVLSRPRDENPARSAWLGAGALAGLACLFRHTSMVIVPAFLLTLALRMHGAKRRSRVLAGGLLWLVGASLVYTPQMAISWRDKGTLLYHEEARNVWFGMHCGLDWSRWAETDERLTLGPIVREEPGAFLRHWSRETVRSLVRYGAMTAGVLPPSLERGTTDVTERRLARACRGLTALAIAVSLAAALPTLVTLRRGRPEAHAARTTPAASSHVFVALLALGWAAAVGMAFSISRFLLAPWMLIVPYAVRGAQIVLPTPLAWRLAAGAWIVALLANSALAVHLVLR